MNLDRTSLIGLVLCVLLYIGYEQYMNNKYPHRFQQTVVSETERSREEKKEQNFFKQGGSSRKVSQVAEKKAVEEIKQLTADELSIENSKVLCVFDQSAGGFSSIKLKEYKSENQSEFLSLIDHPLSFYGAVSDKEVLTVVPYQATRRNQNTIEFSRKEDDWLVSHQISIDPTSGYGAQVEFTWKNEATTARELTSYVFFTENLLFKKAPSSFLPGVPTARQTMAVSINNKTEWLDVQDFCNNKTSSPVMKFAQGVGVDFLGFDSHYFVKAFLPQAKFSNFSINKLANIPQHSCRLSIQNSLDQGLIQPGETARFSFKAWFGPKSTEQMVSFDSRLENSLDLGWFSKISQGLFFVLKQIYSFVGNWGLSIIFVTILLKIIFYPLMKLGAVSMHRMKKLQPEMNKIKEKYKEDQRQQQQELMKFMSANKVNPMKGCLPILPTIPVFFAFYRVLSTSVELRQAPFFAWIIDLSVSDPYYVMPILLSICMIVQQKLTPNTGMDKTQERMMMFLPVVFSLMMLTLPAGMVLYVLTNTVVSILQQQWLNKKLNTV